MPKTCLLTCVFFALLSACSGPQTSTETEADKLLDRSPISHAERLRAPILLTHGENDNRVPVEESRQLASAAAEHGDFVTYVEFAGQGHGIDGLDNTLRYYRAVFEFLEGVTAGE